MYMSNVKAIGIKLGLLKYPLIEYLIKHARSINSSGKMRILDIGCGNHSPSRIKSILPKSIYTGVDIQEYNLDENDKKNADKLLILNVEEFNKELESCLLDGEYDFIILSHVLEHVEYPFEVLGILSKKMAVNGMMYLSFPSEQSIFFPSAKGTLNFYDDSTHIWIPSIREILNFLSAKSILPIHITKQNYGGIIQWLLSRFKIFNVFISNVLSTTLSADSLLWNLYGFESIIIVQSRIHLLNNKVD
jgi:2-polyprenyl-3-methyl-5-hydroxy-6-metoxy-1,4-benzoquinol methylase